MAEGVFGGAVMFHGTVADVSVDKFGEGVHLVVLVELELTELDFSLDVMSPIVGFLLALEVVADGGVAFDADDCAPDGCAVFVFAFEN